MVKRKRSRLKSEEKREKKVIIAFKKGRGIRCYLAK